MKMNADFANKTVKNLQAEIDSILQEEMSARTYSHAASETPVISPYDFQETQAKLAALREKVAAIRHAVNRFNVRTKLPGYQKTVDEGLGYMSVLHREKQRLYAMTQIPEVERTRAYGSKEADYVHRNFDPAEVQKAYKEVCDELMRVQQAINVVNLTREFDVDIEL